MYSVQGGHNGTNNSFFICRSSQGGTDYDIGHLTWEGCNILTGEILQLRVKYQVLVNLEGSARLMWKNWQQFSPLNITVGAVNVAQDIYVVNNKSIGILSFSNLYSSNSIISIYFILVLFSGKRTRKTT